MEKQLEQVENNGEKHLISSIQNKQYIPGLIYLPNFITKQEEQQLMKAIDLQEWNTQLKRRTQHYGYRYDYQSKQAIEKLGDLPEFTQFLLQKLEKCEHTQQKFDQLIINEYEPGQGISPHIDKIDTFDEIIVSLSLNSNCIMDFQKDQKKIQIPLRRRSLLILTGESRFKWKHSIQSRKNDLIDGVKQIRSKRVSLTFRKLKTN